MKLSELLCYVAGYEEFPPRTGQLEQQVEIGTGFQGKWYRSQREHWLGWLIVQQNKYCARPPRLIWSSMNSSPMMFWLAECAGIEDRILDEVYEAVCEVAKAHPNENPSHGKAVRDALNWEFLEASILQRPIHIKPEVALAMGVEAFDLLQSLRPEFNKYAVKSTST